MKSFLSQGKNISIAIEKALILADYPDIFTIKVVDKGIQSIFWWLKKNATIIFSYEDNKINIDNKKNKYIHKKNTANYKNKIFHDEPSFTSTIQQNKKLLDFNNKNKNTAINTRNKYDSTKLSELYIRNDDNKIIKNNKEKQEKIQKDNIDKKNVIKQNNIFTWQDVHINFLKKWLNDLNKYLVFTKKNIEYNIEKKKLTIKIIDLEDKIAKNKKHFYSSIVLLLYQTMENEFNINNSNNYIIIIE